MRTSPIPMNTTPVQANVCNKCRQTLSTGWKRPISSAAKASIREIATAWRIPLFRRLRSSPNLYLVYEGKIRDLSDSECPLCKAISQVLEQRTDRTERLRYLPITRMKVRGSWREQIVPPGYLDRFREFVDQVLQCLYGADTFKITLEYHVLQSEVWEVSRLWGKLKFFLFAEHDSPAAQFISRRPGVYDTQSDSTFELLRQWISECNASHQCFGATDSVISGPRRLIELIGDQPEIRSVRLVDTSSIRSQGAPQYLALSYCWGNRSQDRQKKTTHATLNEHRVGIQVSVLPKTIHDAIIVCSRLGVSHLWVDALCIVQDDVEDKLFEIARMGQIYSNAYLTIVAASAKGSSDGFLQPRKVNTFTAPIRCPNGAITEIKWNLGGLDMLNSSVIRTETDDGRRIVNLRVADVEPWHSRGWTFQELLLSKRTIVFSSFQPYWFCAESACAAGHPPPSEYLTAVGLREALPGPLSAGMFEQAVMDGRIGQTITPLSFGYLWPWLAENYSARVLSDLNDKILAIHSVKERYRERGDKYIAGAWLQHLSIDLLWSPVRRHRRSNAETEKFGKNYCRGRIYNIPSWSWLSFDGSIRFEVIWHALYLGKAHTAEDVIGHIDWRRSPPTDSFGRLTGEPLRLHGTVKRILVVPSKAGFDQSLPCYNTAVWNQEKKAYRIEVDSDLFLSYRIGQVVFDEYIEDDMPWTVSDSNDNFEMKPLVLNCLLVATAGNRSADRTLGTMPWGYTINAQGDEVAYGVILGDVQESDCSQKRRIGLFRGDEGLSAYFDGAEEQTFDLL